MSGTIFFDCWTSSISAYFAGLRIPAWPAALKRWRKGCKNWRVKRGSLQSQNRRWTWSRMLRQVLPVCRIRLRRKARGYSRHFVKKWLDKYRETWSKRIQSRRSIEFSRLAKDAVLDVSTRRLVATEEEDQEHLNFHEDSKKYEETRRFKKLRNRRQRQHLATQSPIYLQIACRTWRRFSQLWDKDIVSVREIKMKDLDVNAAKWCIFMSVTLQAPFHVGTDCTENLGSTRNLP